MTTCSSSGGSGALEAVPRPNRERGDDFSFAHRHRRATRVLQGVTSLLVAVPLAWQLANAPPARATVTVTNPSSVIGVYAGAGQASEVLGIEHRLGLRSMYAMDFLDGSSWSTLSDPDWLLQVWGHTGLKMIWGVDMLPNSGASLAVGATGAYDSWYRLLAERLVAGGQGSSLIRLGWEFNGGWFPWAANGQAAAFVQYWRDIVDTMRSVPGGHFRFEWNPTRGDMGVGPLSEYYPGNQYVNVIGLDVYDIEWGHYPGAVAEWQHMLTQPYGLDWLASFGAAHGKPISFPEWGLGWGTGGNGPAGGGDNAYFVEHMAEFIRTHDVANAVAWDWGSRPMISSYYPAAEQSFFDAFSPHATPSTPSGIVASAASPASPGYWLATARGRVYGEHTPWAGMASSRVSTPIAGIAAAGSGYLLVNPKGGVHAFHATWHGSLAGRRLPAPVVGIAVDPRTGGYWLATSRGNVYPFAAPWRGSRARRGVEAAIVGIAATPTGYLLVSVKGNVYNFHTPWYGSKAHGHVPAPVVGIAVDGRTGGYWLVTSKGNVYAFGAPWLGSERGKRLSSPIVSIFASGAGYSLVSSSGAVYSFRPSGT
ncbi:MAG TPA: glycosyl hydrolase [Acidimicrobiales bacterium]|nr:glycosyl hydrolase [Acidimicrobiales bacterium]